MQRTKKERTVTAILCSDLHIREDLPVCRLDNFVESQFKKLDFISALQKKYDCPVLCGGDVFHAWKPSPFLLSKTIEHLPKQFFSVYGNHDLPQHNLELQNKCGIFTLYKAGFVSIGDDDNYTMVHWGMEVPKHDDNKILLWHKFTYQGKEPWPDCVEMKANKILKQFNQFKLIVTGDNHQPFVQEYEGRILVNPGSLSRQRTSETHLPRVYLYYAESNTVEPVYIPIEENVISREHLVKEEQRNGRIDTFVSQLSENWKVSMSFEDNLQRFEKKNQVRKSVMEIVYKTLEV